MNIAGRIITRSDIAAAVVGSALAVALAVVPGLVGQHHPAAASSASRGQAMPPTRTSDGSPATTSTPSAGLYGSSTPTPSAPPPVCNLPAAVSSSHADDTAKSWGDLYLSGPTADCSTAAWRLALNSAAGGQQVSMNRFAAIPTASQTVGSADITECTGSSLTCPAGATRAVLSTTPITPDPKVSDTQWGSLRLNLEQNEAGLWQVTWMAFTPPVS